MAGPLTQAHIIPSDAGPLGDADFRSSVGHGVVDALNRGVVGQTLGAPADIANTLANLGKAAYGYAGHKLGLLSANQMPAINDNPTGGSEWWGKLMQDHGMVTPNRNVAAETIAGAAAPLAFAGAPKVAGALHEALPVIRDGIESGMAATGNYPEMVPPRRFRGPPLAGMPNGGTVMVDGKPVNFGTDARLTAIAKKYADSNDLDYKPLTSYQPVDPMRAAGVAHAYDNMPHDPSNPDVAAAYQKMMEETKAQYQALTDAGYKFDFIRGDDPYGNPRNAVKDLVLNKHMSVFPTDTGFGGPASTGVDTSNNPLELPSGLTMGGEPAAYNDLFRAVHDAFGHGQYGVGFRAGGEENAFQAHARMYSPEAVPAATSETRGQNSWVNFGPYGEQNQTASPATTEYAPQKTGVMPPWTWTSGVGND